MNKLSLIVVFAVVASGVFFIITNLDPEPNIETHSRTSMTNENTNQNSEIETNERSSESSSNTPGEQAFSRLGLLTDTSVGSIDQEKIFSGGPGKDGIPAISNPTFTTVEEAKGNIADTTQGILVEFEGEKRYYPYSILVWHEIVNDSIGDTHFSATFCPLCGSGIVFDRQIGEDIFSFGVSGLLFESNLLMYDTFTESLWSQARGETVVGELTGTKLEILPMQLISFQEVQDNHPDAQVLSTNTGYIRDYRGNPYSGYEEQDNTFFPISVQDNRFFSKEIMYVIPFEEQSIVFRKDALEEGATETFTFGANTLVVSKKNSEINASINGNAVPGYFEMWFSWAQHHQESGVVWDL